MQQKISIFGCGWLGEALALHLIKQGFHIKGTTTTHSKLQHLMTLGIDPFFFRLETISANIAEILNSEILIISLPFKNIEGFIHLLHWIKKSPVKNIVFISSIKVYADSDEKITEQSPLNQSNLALIEQMLSDNAQFSTTIIRFGEMFGYNRKPGIFYSQGTRIEDPDVHINMIHRDDCILILNKIITKDIWGQVFNACADSHPTRREFFAKKALEIGLDAPEFDETSKCDDRIVSNAKLKTLLDYDFKYPDLLNIVEEE